MIYMHKYSMDQEQTAESPRQELQDLGLEEKGRGGTGGGGRDTAAVTAVAGSRRVSSPDKYGPERYGIVFRLCRFVNTRVFE